MTIKKEVVGRGLDALLAPQKARLTMLIVAPIMKK